MWPSPASFGIGSSDICQSGSHPRVPARRALHDAALFETVSVFCTGLPRVESICSGSSSVATIRSVGPWFAEDDVVDGLVKDLLDYFRVRDPRLLIRSQMGRFFSMAGRHQGDPRAAGPQAGVAQPV